MIVFNIREKACFFTLITTDFSQRFYRLPNLLRRREREIRTNCKDDVRSLGIAASAKPKTFPNYTFNSVTFRGSPELAVHTYPQPIIFRRVVSINKREAVSMQTTPSTINRIILPPFAYKGSFWKPVIFQLNYAERRLRPLALRALRIARPALVLIRARKPWVRLRLMLLGWNVLLLIFTSS